MDKYIIVGGGLAGLSLAYELLQAGKDVLIVEKAPEVGGMCRSVTFDGCRLDIGDHKIHLKDETIANKIREVVDPEKIMKITRKGNLCIHGKYVDWPFRFSLLYQLPLLYGLRIVLDQFTKKKIDNPASYKDELLSLYGPTLYYSFFDPLTRKHTKSDPRYIHPEWAFSSIRAATKIEDKSFKESYRYSTEGTEDAAKDDFNIFSFLRKTLFTNNDKEPFYYFKNGFGTLVESYQDKIISLGGKIKTASVVNDFEIEGNFIKKCIVNDKAYDVDHVVWTVSPLTLCELLKLNAPSLKYLSSTFMYFLLRRCNMKYQTCYYPDTDISFNRAAIFSNHSKSVIHNREVSDVLGLEFTFDSVEEMGVETEMQRKRAIEDMIKVGLVDDETAIVNTTEISVPNTYPKMTLDYKGEYKRLEEMLKPFQNISTFGRQATFSYDNTDIVINAAINCELLKPSK
jgi:protoporphyrinogen oxidase